MMRKLMAILVMTLAIPGWAAAQSQKTVKAPPAQAKTPQAPPASDVGASLKYLERKWVVALCSKDIKTLTDILDDSYMDTDESGVRNDKSGLLAAIKSTDLQLTSIKLSGMVIHSFGIAAVATGKAEQTGTFKGQAVAPTVMFTDTFVLMNGAWKVVASHRSAPHE
jgi:hypothetical protein